MEENGNLKLNREDVKEKVEDSQKQFLELIQKVYEDSVGYEEYGETIEFYDECGAVLMQMQPSMDQQGKIVFTFGNAPVGDNVFVYEETGEESPVFPGVAGEIAADMAVEFADEEELVEYVDSNEDDEDFNE